jgi:thiamine-phosphate pyrophosphorylase
MKEHTMQGLYLVTDRELCADRGLENVVLEALKGGTAYVQLREKKASTRFFVDAAQKLKNLLAPFKVPLIINDRIDIALAVEAEGVHIGQEDMPHSLARKLMGPEAIIGLSVETWKDVETAQNLDVDYLGVSPVFETPTKTDTRGSWGLNGLAKIKQYSRHPLVAIGGLGASNVKEVVKAGADCIAVVSAICSAPDPFRAARDLETKIKSALKQR